MAFLTANKSFKNKFSSFEKAFRKCPESQHSSTSSIHAYVIINKSIPVFLTIICLSALVGPFQSDPLLVPEHCEFDHIHNAEKCMLFADWQKKANKSCVSSSKLLENFGMLLPCGVDMFSGVEFVCCPKSGQNQGRWLLKFMFVKIYSSLNC